MHDFFFEFLDYYTFVMIWRKKNLLDKTKWDLCWCGFGNELKLLLLLIMHFWHIVVARKRSTNERSFLHSSSTHHWPLKSPGPTANVIPSQDDEICKKNHWYRSGIPSLSIYIAFYIVPTAVEKNLISWPGSKESFRHILHKRRQKGVSFEFSL